MLRGTSGMSISRLIEAVSLAIIGQQVDFKLVVLVFTAPSYLAEDCKPIPIDRQHNAQSPGQAYQRVFIRTRQQ